MGTAETKTHNEKVIDIQTYTTQGAVLNSTVLVPDGANDFAEMVCEALESGCVLLDLVGGAKLILNPLNAVAVEIGEVRKVTANDYEQA